MNRLKAVTFSTLSVAGFLVSSIANVAHADATIIGNGAFSANQIAIEEQKTLDIRQVNNSDIQNNVASIANSGGNQSGFNTGGNTSINTGPAQSNVNISNAANMNQLQLSNGCGCANGSTEAVIGGNGAFSYNSVNVDTNEATRIAQNNINQIRNQVMSNANTGNNGGQSQGFYYNPGHEMSYPQQHQSYNNSYGQGLKEEKISYHEDYDKKDQKKNEDHYNSGYQKDDNKYEMKDEKKNDKYDKETYQKDYGQKSEYNYQKSSYGKSQYDNNHYMNYQYNEDYQKKGNYNNSYSDNYDGSKYGNQKSYNSFDWMNKYPVHKTSYNNWGGNNLWGNGYWDGGNTGGNTNITTGSALSNVYLNNMANANILRY